MATTNTTGGPVDLLSAASVLHGTPATRIEPQVGRILPTCAHCVGPTSFGDTYCASCEQIEILSVHGLGGGEYIVVWEYVSRDGGPVTTKVRTNFHDVLEVGAASGPVLDDHVAVQIAAYLEQELTNGRRWRAV